MIEKKAVRHVIGFSLENGSDRPRAAAWLNKKFFSKKSKIMEMMIQHALS